MGFSVEIVGNDAAAVELIETRLSDEEVFGELKANSVIYPEAVVPVTAQDVINC